MRLYFYMRCCLIEFADVLKFVLQGFETPFVDLGYQLLVIVPEMDFTQPDDPGPTIQLPHHIINCL